MSHVDVNDIHEAVKDRYGRIATEFKPEIQASCCSTDSSEADCCGSVNSGLYDTDLSSLPSDVTGLSLGCGDPITLANLKAGQVVLDLGSGGGIDCFLAAQKVGETGQVIGVDMTPAMLEKANRNKAKLGVANVEFRHGQIEALPVDDDSVDVIISNCVINLAPDKTAVFREAFRVLKPGGQLAVSDMITRGHFSAQERADKSAWAGCISGAEDVADTIAWMKSAGFTQISVVDKEKPEVELANVPAHEGPAQLFSGRITAVKPQQ